MVLPGNLRRGNFPRDATEDMQNLLQFLQEWYLEQCNGDWEHEFGIKIETLDNPG